MTFKPAALALILSLLAPLALAESDEERWYQVEILVFANPDRDTDSPEQWPTYPTLAERPYRIEIPNTLRFDQDDEETEPDAEPPESHELTFGPERTLLDGDLNELTPFKLLGESEYQLADEIEALSRNKGYRLLFHQAWVQPVPDRDNVELLRISGGDTYGQQAELQGYLELYVERYFHLTTDLQLIHYAHTDNPFRLIDDNLDSNGLAPFPGLSLLQGPPVYQSAIRQDADSDRFFVATESISLQQRRRMRSGELHYLDNPEFGMLILITPIDR
ncbi:CsiV family protein [Saccharospirillum mangrovi]|uniref:CsiV family protein n=1 Tax=Saccharospirillum mangrovi TaxID=2161747 RepID=UPI000D3CDB48|nr:CsiV family protein [Saccharospirillum mangrovi]